MELPTDYNGDNMLIGANNLNNEIKQYLETGRDASVLEDYKLDLEEYLNDIPPYNFSPRSDNLTKEGILTDLNENLRRINQLSLTERGGKRKAKRNKKTRSKKMRSRRVKKSLRRNRRKKIRTRRI
jgi:hypothetical protein